MIHIHRKPAHDIRARHRERTFASSAYVLFVALSCVAHAAESTATRDVVAQASGNANQTLGAAADAGKTPPPKTQGSAVTVEPGSSEATPPIDEVIVSGTRTLADLRKEMRVLEDRFLAKYNELNKEPEFAINCAEEATVGSRFVNHVCRPKYVDTALRKEATGEAFSAAPLIAAKKTAFQKNMIDLTSKDEEMRKLARQNAGLQERYDQLLRRAFGAKD